MSLQVDWLHLAIGIQVGYPRGQFEEESVVDSWMACLAFDGICYSGRSPSLANILRHPLSLLRYNLSLQQIN